MNELLLDWISVGDLLAVAGFLWKLTNDVRDVLDRSIQ